MVNATADRSAYLVPLLGLLVLTAAAWLRGAEYDEQYTLFLTAGVARPDWPATVFPAGLVVALQRGHASLAEIGGELRATDVHPPLYFWAVSVWRWMAGPSLFAARMLSVLCGAISIALVGNIARRCFVQPAAAMLITLGCYGFVYTNAIARGFAPAQMLTLCGVALLLGRRQWLAGICLGAACCCNYLAVFVAVAALVAAAAWRAVPAMVPFLALDGWFFAAQHGARPEQFPPFALWRSVVRLAEYQTAAVFGGLPMYVDGWWRIGVGATLALAGLAVVVQVANPRRWRANPAMRMAIAGAAAPPAGLLMLGAVFNNSPIELRYLSFGLPFVALLASSALNRANGCRYPARQPRRARASGFRHGELQAAPGLAATAIQQDQTGCGRLLPVVFLLTAQCGGIAGLLLAPQTMQPARGVAGEAAQLVGSGVVLLPRGNDGVGIVGAFAIEAPAALPLLLISPTDRVADKVAGFRRVVLALLAQDRDSIAAIANLHAAFGGPDWRRVAVGTNIEVFQRTGEAE